MGIRCVSAGPIRARERAAAKALAFQAAPCGDTAHSVLKERNKIKPDILSLGELQT